MVARWLQTVLPDEDRYSAASMPFMTLMHRLRRYAALLPPAARIPKSYLDELVRGLPIQINVMAELAAAIVYQKQRISQFAENEKSLPLGMTSEQQRKEVHELTDMLMKMLAAQTALGVVPGYLSRQISMSSNTNTLAITATELDRPASDPFNRFLEANPNAISTVMLAIDAAINQASDAAPEEPDRPAVSWRRVDPGLPAAQPPTGDAP